MPFLNLTGVTKRFGEQQVIKGVDIAAEEGEFVVFVGPSGCGKSTLLRMIAGLEDISGGEVSIDGRVVTNVEPAKRKVAMVFQSYALYPHMSVYENMAFGLRMVRTPETEIRTLVAEAARILQIEPLLERKPRQLSGGQRQRVAIGRAIVRKPKLFLFDEPLSNLDAELRTQMRVEIAKLHRDLGVTMVYVTHDQIEAMTLADRIVVLRAGLVEQIGTPTELYDAPANTFVACFIGSPKMNLVSGVITAAEEQAVTVRNPAFIGGEIRVVTRGRGHGKVGDAVKVGFRPEHLVLGGPDPVVNMNLELTENLGGATQIYGSIAGEAVSVTAPGRPLVMVGSTVPLGIDPSHIYLFDSHSNAL